MNRPLPKIFQIVWRTTKWRVDWQRSLRSGRSIVEDLGVDTGDHPHSAIGNSLIDSQYMKDNLENDNQPVKPVTYSVIKTGLVGLTKYLATYWIGSNIRCNALSPGGIFNDQGEEFLEKVRELIPFKRMAYKNEYHGAIQFLCSDASSYMNGQNIIIDGGRSIW